MAKKRQVERVIDYMKQFGSISTLEAVADLGCMRLASRINDIKRMGIAVRTEYVAGKNRFGEKTHYARYTLAEKSAAV